MIVPTRRKCYWIKHPQKLCDLSSNAVMLPPLLYLMVMPRSFSHSRPIFVFHHISDVNSAAALSVPFVAPQSTHQIYGPVHILYGLTLIFRPLTSAPLKVVIAFFARPAVDIMTSAEHDVLFCLQMASGAALFISHESTWR